MDEYFKPFFKKIKTIPVFKSEGFIYGLYVVMAVIEAVQQSRTGSHNNFLIFQHSVFHFFAGLNPYLEYPKEYGDIFLYNPSFPVLFLPFAYLPTLAGLITWSVLTTSVYFLAIKSLPLTRNQKLFIFYVAIPELNTAVSNLQTNPLIAAFTILAMTSLEKGAYKKFALYPALNFFIKGYGGIAAIFFLLKKPTFKIFFYLCICFLAVGLLPLCFYSFTRFTTIYQQWFESLKNYGSKNAGISVMGIARSLIYKDVSTVAIQLAGVAVFLITFIAVLAKKNYEQVKFYFLANVLIWMVIFNHVAESPTYLIASTGVLIWFVCSKKKPVDLLLFIFFCMLTLLSPTDLFPKYLRVHYVVPYCLKALPCIFIWIKIQFALIGVPLPQPKQNI